MYCPNCFYKSKNPDICSQCNFDLKSVKEFHIHSGELFRKALTEYKAGNLQTCSDNCILALSLFPYNPELLRFSILVFMDTGNYVQAKDAIDILEQFDAVQAEELKTELIKIIERYNSILRLVKQGQSDVILKDYKNHPELTSFEKEMLRTIIDFQTGDKISVTQNNAKKLSGSSSFNKIFLTAGLIIIIFTIIFISQRKENIIIEDNSKPTSLLKDSLNKLIEINDNLTKLTFSNFSRNKESLLSSYLVLQKSDQNLCGKLDRSFRNNLAYKFYISGRKAYLTGNYTNACNYFDASYKLNKDTWFSDDALYYYALCLKLQKNISYRNVLRELIKNHNTSLYKKEAESILIQSHETMN